MRRYNITIFGSRVAGWPGRPVSPIRHAGPRWGAASDWHPPWRGATALSAAIHLCLGVLLLTTMQHAYPPDAPADQAVAVVFAPAEAPTAAPAETPLPARVAEPEPTPHKPESPPISATQPPPTPAPPPEPVGPPVTAIPAPPPVPVASPEPVAPPPLPTPAPEPAKQVPTIASPAPVPPVVLPVPPQPPFIRPKLPTRSQSPVPPAATVPEMPATAPAVPPGNPAPPRSRRDGVGRLGVARRPRGLACGPQDLSRGSAPAWGGRARRGAVRRRSVRPRAGCRAGAKFGNGGARRRRPRPVARSAPAAVSGDDDAGSDYRYGTDSVCPGGVTIGRPSLRNRTFKSWLGAILLQRGAGRRTKLRGTVSSDPKPQRAAIRLIGSRVSESRYRAAFIRNICTTRTGIIPVASRKRSSARFAATARR